MPEKPRSQPTEGEVGDRGPRLTVCMLIFRAVSSARSTAETLAFRPPPDANVQHRTRPVAAPDQPCGLAFGGHCSDAAGPMRRARRALTLVASAPLRLRWRLPLSAMG